YSLNLTTNGYFKPVDEIRKGMRALTENLESGNLVHMCGSGVTACHNVFAAELAGISEPKLYVGSWSEWIQNPSRPVNTGA
ncbi:MAG: sulfurtransferase, partial [Gammaproteobacteria bacterium]|nr:sulfurtransferase [Gammaproteobacteria bacterium]